MQTETKWQRRGPKPLERSTGSGPVFEIRSGAGMTQADFAESVGLSRRNVQRCEALGVWPDSVVAQRALIAFANARGINYSTII